MNLPQALIGTKLDELPEGLREIAELVGLDAALKLTAAHGGVRIFIPLKCPPEHAIAATVGDYVAARLSNAYGGTYLYVPGVSSILRRRRDAAIVQAYDKGKSATFLARQHGITERQVRAIIAKARQ